VSIIHILTYQNCYLIIINYIINVIIVSDYIHDYIKYYTSFDKAILCGFNHVPTWSEFINRISCIYYNYPIYYLITVTPYIMHLVAECIFAKYSNMSIVR